MIATVLRIGWLHLRRDPVALVLTFLLPVVFFSVFAAVFGAMEPGEAGAARAVPALVVLEDSHPLGTRLARRIAGHPGLELIRAVGTATRADALALVRSGAVTVGAVIPAGFGAALADRGREPLRIELLADRSDPTAVPLVRGIVQSSLLALAVEGAAGPRAEAAAADAASDVVRSGLAPAAVGVSVVDVLGRPGKNPSIAYLAAGIGVMFLLFAVSGRSALLLEERESGVLTRMRAARVGLSHLLAGRWLLLWMLGAVQVTVMFVWGALAFGLDLWAPRHLSGFAVMTVATAAAAAGFGLMLSSICRTRAQLNGVSTVVVLILSVLGGSMFPSFLMPEGIRTLGKLTFNAWALAGYQQVFWYEAPIVALWPNLLVLGLSCLGFLAAARWFARRWEGC